MCLVLRRGGVRPIGEPKIADRGHRADPGAATRAATTGLSSAWSSMLVPPACGLAASARLTSPHRMEGLWSSCSGSY